MKLRSQFVCLVSSSLALTGCGLGTVAAVGGGGSGGGGGTTVTGPTTVSGVSVTNTKVEPAQVHFVLTDPDVDDTANVELRYTLDGTFANSSVIASLAHQSTSAGGQGHDQPWNYAANLGAALTPGVTVFVVVAGETNFAPGVNASTVALGNDAPVVDLPAAQFPSGGEVSGILPINFTVSDSSSEAVRVQIEINSEPGFPSSGWRLARPAGLAASDLTPTHAFANVTALAAGTNLVFAWDSEFDLHGADTPAQLRMRAQELSAPGAPSPFGLSPVLHVDNNHAPLATIDVADFFVNPDEHRGIPVPITVRDDENDDVEIVVQWRYQDDDTVPALPTGASALQTLLKDPRERARYHIATELPLTYEGAVTLIGLPDQIRLSELATTELLLVSSRGNGPIGSMLGRTVEILRPDSKPTLVSNTWAAGTALVAPAGVLAIGDGETVLALENTTASTWRLREIEAATGVAGANFATNVLAAGHATAMAWESFETSVLVAWSDPNGWHIERVDLLTGLHATLFNSAAGLPAGDVRGIAALDEHACVVTVANSLVRVRYLVGAAASAVDLFANAVPNLFLTPWGVASDERDPRHVWVAENGRDRVVSVDLASLSISPIVTSGSLAVRRPEALALDARNGLVHVVTAQNANAREVRAFRIGGRGGAVVYELAGGLPANLRGLCVGDSRFVAAVDSATGALYAGGGVEQVRTVTSYQPSRQKITVDSPFDPPLTAPRRWRCRDRANPYAASAAGGRRNFVWDRRDAQRGGDVFLQIIALDADSGELSDPAPKHLEPAIDSTPESTSSFLDCSLAGCGADLADMDGDGDLDVIGVDGTGVHVLAQLGNGPFAQMQSNVLTVSSAPPLVTADVNGDGLTDFCVNGRVYFQSSTTPGTFVNGPVIIAGGAIHAAGDVDRNGKLDLIATHGAGINVYLQSAGGSFAVSSAPDLPYVPERVVLTDVNGDGRLDLIAMRPSQTFFSNELALHLQGANGTFPAVESDSLNGLSDYARFSSVEIADIYGDGRPDLIAAVRLDDTQGAGGEFGSEVWIQNDVGFLPWSALTVLGGYQQTPDALYAQAVDVDGDRDLDILCQNAGHGFLPRNVCAFLQRGASDSPAPHFAAVPDQTWPFENVLIADLDGDRAPDLVEYDSSANELRTYTDHGLGALTASDIALGSSSTGYGAVSVGDYDGDSDSDLLGCWQYVDRLDVFFQDAPRRFAPLPQVHYFTESLFTQVESGDFDLDGRSDFAVLLDPFSSEPYALVVQYTGTSATTATLDKSLLLDDWGPMAASDLNADGRLDFVLRVYDSNTNSAQLWVIDKQQFPSNEYEVRTILAGSTGGGCLVADVDRDGDQDVIELSGTSLQLHRQTAEFTFSLEPIFANVVQLLRVRDIDADGRADVLVVYAGSIRALFQEASGAWTLSSVISLSPFSVLMDADDDRLQDLYVRATGTPLHRLVKQWRPRVFTEYTTPTSLPRSGLDWDIDGDGDPDLLDTQIAAGSIGIDFGGD